MATPAPFSRAASCRTPSPKTSATSPTSPSLDVLSGWASQCEGNTVLARDFYSRASQSRPGIYIPAPGDRTLAIADIGLAPEKVGDGEYGEVPHLHRARPRAGILRRSSWPARRHGQPASAKTSTGRPPRAAAGRSTRSSPARPSSRTMPPPSAPSRSHLADIALDVAVNSHGTIATKTTTDADEALAWAAGLAVLGIGALLMAEATAPEADTRYWDNLPAHIDYITPTGRRACRPKLSSPTTSGATLGSQPARIRTDPKAGAASSTSDHASPQKSPPRRRTRCWRCASFYSRTFSVRKCRPSRSSISMTQRSRSAFSRLRDRRVDTRLVFRRQPLELGRPLGIERRRIEQRLAPRPGHLHQHVAPVSRLRDGQSSRTRPAPEARRSRAETQRWQESREAWQSFTTNPQADARFATILRRTRKPFGQACRCSSHRPDLRPAPTPEAERARRLRARGDFRPARLRRDFGRQGTARGSSQRRL